MRCSVERVKNDPGRTQIIYISDDGKSFIVEMSNEEADEHAREIIVVAGIRRAGSAGRAKP